MGIHFRRTPLLGMIGVLALGGASVARAQDTSAATRQDTSAYRSSQNQADTMQAGRSTSSAENGSSTDTALKAKPGVQTGPAAQDTGRAAMQDTSSYRSSQNQTDTTQVNYESKGKSLSAADTVVCKDGSNSPNSAKGACGSHGGVDTAATWAALKARGKQPSGHPTSKDSSSSNPAARPAPALRATAARRAVAPRRSGAATPTGDRRPPRSRWPSCCSEGGTGPHRRTRSAALPLAAPRRHIGRMTTSGFANLTVLDHPLIQHKLSILRDRETSTRDFKQLVGEIATLMAYEATKDLATEPVEIETPLERMTGRQVAGKKLTLVPILRAGLGMVDGIAQLIPSARVGHIGLYRDHDTLKPVDYYFKIPAAEVERDFYVLDPMLATGGSAVAAVSAAQGGGGPAHPVPLDRRRAGRCAADAGRASRGPRVHRRARPRAQRPGLHSAGPWRRGRSAVRHPSPLSTHPRYRTGT